MLLEFVDGRSHHLFPSFVDTRRSAPAPRVEPSAQLSGLSTSLACQCCSKAGTFKFTFYRRSSCSPNPGSAGCQLSWSQRLVYGSLFASLVVVVALHVLVTLVFVAVAVGTVVPCAVRSGFIAVVPKQLREFPSFMCLNTLSFRGPCRGTISWSGSRVSLASRSCSLTLRSLRTHLDCCLLLVQVVGHICLRSGGSAGRLLSRRVLFLQGEGPHASSCVQRSRKEWTCGLMGTLWWACSMIFLLTFAVLHTVMYSDLGYSSMACLALGLAVLKWTSTSCLGRFSHSLCRWAPRQTRPARRLSKEDFCRTEL